MVVPQVASTHVATILHENSKHIYSSNKTNKNGEYCDSIVLTLIVAIQVLYSTTKNHMNNITEIWPAE